jgi:hypothetical protein
MEQVAIIKNPPAPKMTFEIVSMGCFNLVLISKSMIIGIKVICL